MQKEQLLLVLQKLGSKAPQTYFFEELGSTMDVAKQIVEGTSDYSSHLIGGDIANGYLVLSQTQTSGRGRGGSEWLSPKGHGLYFSFASLVEKDAEQTLGLSLAIGASVCESLKANGIYCGLKWPNDLIVFKDISKGFKKLGGILIETSISGSKTRAIFVGLGLNVLKTDFPKEVPGISVAEISDQEFSTEAILEILLPNLFRDQNRFLEEGFSAFRNAWRRHSLISSSKAKLLLPEGIVDCKIEDIAADGALVVRIDEKLRNIYAGELSEILPAHQKVLSVAQTIDQFILDSFSEISEEEKTEILDSLKDDTALEEDLVAEAEVKEEAKFKNLSVIIKDMKLGAKVKLGLLGNMTARSLLIRENSRQIRAAVMKNPRLTEAEVVDYAKNANLDKHVFQIIANDNNWMRVYPIQVAIVSNPKTPMDISIRWIKYLKDKELKILAKAKTIPSAVSTQVRKLLETRNKKPGGGGH